MRGLKLEAMRERTPRGGTRWHRSSVKQLLAKAECLRLEEMAVDLVIKVGGETTHLLSRMNEEK